MRTVFGVSDQVRHKPGCRVTGSQQMAGGLIIPIYEAEGLYSLWSENKEAHLMCSYCAAVLRLLFYICKKKQFSLDMAH